MLEKLFARLDADGDESLGRREFAQLQDGIVSLFFYVSYLKRDEAHHLCCSFGHWSFAHSDLGLVRGRVWSAGAQEHRPHVQQRVWRR